VPPGVGITLSDCRELGDGERDEQPHRATCVGTKEEKVPWKAPSAFETTSYCWCAPWQARSGLAPNLHRAAGRSETTGRAWFAGSVVVEPDRLPEDSLTKGACRLRTAVGGGRQTLPASMSGVFFVVVLQCKHHGTKF